MGDIYELSPDVFSLLTSWETGSQDNLGQALFPSSQKGLTEALVRSEDWLLSCLPPAGVASRVMWIGGQLNVAVGKRLAVLGFEREEAVLGRRVNPFHGFDESAAPTVRLSRFFDGAEPYKPFDRLLFHESARYLDSLAMFRQAGQLLATGGEVAIADTFTLQRLSPGEDYYHYLPHFLAQAERFGLTLAARDDLTAEAMPACDFYMHLLDVWRQRLIDELHLSVGQIDNLRNLIDSARRQYATGIRGYFWLRLRRQGNDRPLRWQVGTVGAEQSIEMRALFAEVFGHEMSAEEWFWKYGDDHGKAIGVWEKGRLVGHCGIWKRPVRYFGMPEWAGQVGDVMVAPSGRSAMTRKGPVYLMLATLLECHLGFGTRQTLSFGLPNDRAYALPERLGLYGGSVCRVVEVEWTAGGRASSRSRVREVTLDENGVRDAIEGLWASMAADYESQIIGVRNHGFFDYRYRRRPARHYRFFLVSNRFDSMPLAFIVLAERGAEGVELVDFVAAHRRIPLVVRQARRIVHALGGVPRLFVWTSAYAVDGFASGQVRDLGLNVPFNRWSCGPSLDTLRDRWFLLGGDFDFR